MIVTKLFLTTLNLLTGMITAEKDSALLSANFSQDKL